MRRAVDSTVEDTKELRDNGKFKHKKAKLSLLNQTNNEHFPCILTINRHVNQKLIIDYTSNHNNINTATWNLLQ